MISAAEQLFYLNDDGKIKKIEDKAIITQDTLGAIKKVYALAGVADPNVLADIDNGYLTETKDETGRPLICYKSIAVYSDSAEKYEKRPGMKEYIKEHKAEIINRIRAFMYSEYGADYDSELYMYPTDGEPEFSTGYRWLQDNPIIVCTHREDTDGTEAAELEDHGRQIITDEFIEEIYNAFLRGAI